MDESFVQEVVKGVQIYGYGGAVLLLMVLAAEMFMRWREGQPVWSKEGLNNLLFFTTVGSFTENLILNAFTLAPMWVAYHLSPLRVPVEWWTLPLYFLVGEFGFYWFHRMGHRVRILWADHSIHHSAKTFDFTVNLRHTPFSFLYRAIAWTPLAALGFHPVVLLLFAMTAPSFQTFCHTTRIGRLAPWFEWTFVTPSNHAVHHACNPIYIDKNYGGLLMIWDHLFRTYQRLEDHTPPVFGITRPVQTTNPFKVLAHEFVHVGRDFAAAPTARQKMGVIFGAPGETFEVEKSNHHVTAPQAAPAPVEA